MQESGRFQHQDIILVSHALDTLTYDFKLHPTAGKVFSFFSFSSSFTHLSACHLKKGSNPKLALFHTVLLETKTKQKTNKKNPQPLQQLKKERKSKKPKHSIYAPACFSLFRMLAVMSVSNLLYQRQE